MIDYVDEWTVMVTSVELLDDIIECFKILIVVMGILLYVVSRG